MSTPLILSAILHRAITIPPCPDMIICVVKICQIKYIRKNMAASHISIGRI
jgi:hypothetical protein